MKTLCPYYNSSICMIPNMTRFFPEEFVIWDCPLCKPEESLRVSIAQIEQRITLIKKLSSILKDIVPSSDTEVLCDEDCLEQIINSGELFSTKDILLLKGRPNFCHWNSAEVFIKKPESFIICRGYAFYQGTWVQHTWLYDVEKDRLVDPTFRFEKYYGFRLSAEKALQFCKICGFKKS